MYVGTEEKTPQDRNTQSKLRNRNMSAIRHTQRSSEGREQSQKNPESELQRQQCVKMYSYIKDCLADIHTYRQAGRQTQEETQREDVSMQKQ